MARDYGRIRTAFWNHPKVRKCSDRGKLLANYLMTGPHSNAAGAYLLPDAYVADDLGWSSEAVSKAFAELFEIGFAERFQDGRHVVVCDFLDWNPVENPNVAKGIAKQIDQLPDDPAIRHVRNRLEQYAKHFTDGFETVFERFRNMEMEPNRDGDGDGDGTEMESCAERAAAPPPIITIPTNRPDQEYPVSQAQADEFAKLYPNVDVEQQLRELRGWSISNEKRRKTYTGIPKFMNAWLAKEQNANGRPSGNRAPQQQGRGSREASELALAAIKRSQAHDSAGGTQQPVAGAPASVDGTARAVSHTGGNPLPLAPAGRGLPVPSPYNRGEKLEESGLLPRSETFTGVADSIGLRTVQAQPGEQVLPDTRRTARAL